MVEHECGLPLLEPGDLQKCTYCGDPRKLRLVPTDAEDRIAYGIGRYLLKECPACERKYLVARVELTKETRWAIID
jgi:hypothetical protein